jgi:hypothetical protein
MERTGDWTLLKGTLTGPHGQWEIRDAYRSEGKVIRGTRRFTWKGTGPCSRATLSVRFQAPAAVQAQVVMPGILYNGNPSGARSGRVPVYGGQPGEYALYEEHRFPAPFVSLEYASTPQRLGAALHVLPTPAPYGNQPDQWWSLGAAGVGSGQELLLLSGPSASNGRKSVIKAVQPGFLPYDDVYLNVPPGGIVEKTFWLEVFPGRAEGAGFSTPLHTSIDLFAPFNAQRYPPISEILQAKFHYARTRWLERGAVAGFSKYPDRPFLVMGWCGQAEAPGYALQVLASELGEPQAIHWAAKSLDFLSGAAFYEAGFRTWYDVEKGQWSGHEILSQGQAMLTFARAIRSGRARGAATQRWEQFLRRASDFHARRILAQDWRPPSTSEAFLIAPLCQASRLFAEPQHRQAAIKAGEHYAARHLSMREPYWGGALDASCEDKEGAYAAFQGFLALHELTGEARFLEWARHACDVVLSYLVLWDIDLPPGRLRDHAFKTAGWTVVSPQNQHIDAYGVIMAPEIYRLGDIIKDQRLKKLAVVMYRACGQLIDPYGSQGEQPQHTNYTQARAAQELRALRGGYNETWTVFWITAHFLNAAAQLKELGLNLAE